MSQGIPFDIIQVRLKTFKWYCGKVIQETMHQISPESLEFCRRCYKNIWSLIPDMQHL